MRRFAKFLPVFVTAALAIVVLNRCGQNEPYAPPKPGTFEHVYMTIKSSNCVECHKPKGAATVEDGVKLDFTDAKTAYKTLTDPKAVVSGGASKKICADVKLVTAKDVKKSYFAAVLIKNVHSKDFAGKKGCTPYTTHLTDTNLDDDQKDSIQKWITDGAKND